MGREEEVIKARLMKIEDLQKKDINPYPYNFDKKNSAAELQEKYKKLKNDESKSDKAKTAGRVMIIRDIGKLIFASLREGNDCLAPSTGNIFIDCTGLLSLRSNNAAPKPSSSKWFHEKMIQVFPLER